MAANAAEQFNSSYIRLPNNAKLNALAFGLRQVIGEIYSFTGKDKGGKELSCYRTYKKFTERCGVSRATVGRALKIGREKALIKGDNKSGYVCLIEADDGEFFRLPSWACLEEFSVRKNEKRKLTKSERSLYAVFYTRCTAKGNNRHTFEASTSDLAELTGLSERTVHRAIWTLIRARLIYRPKGDKGINAYKVSKYTLDYKFVLLKEKNEKKIRKEIERATAQAEAEPFPEFSPTNKEGEEEFTLHALPRGRRQKKSNKKRKKLSIPEKDLYVVGTDEWCLPKYDFSEANTEELQALYSFYRPVYANLDVISLGFMDFLRLELEERAGESPPQEI